MTLIILKCIIVWIILIIVLLIFSFIEYLIGDNYHLTFKEFFTGSSGIAEMVEFVFFVGTAIIIVVLFFSFIVFLYNFIPL